MPSDRDLDGFPFYPVVYSQSVVPVVSILTTLNVSVHLPPLKKGGRGGFRMGNEAKIPPHPPLPKGGIEQSCPLERFPR